jgi:hypothetical protein
MSMPASGTGFSVMGSLLFFADHLIEFMGAVLVVALSVRYVAFRAAQRDQAYFKTFSRSVEKILETENQVSEVKNVEVWLQDVLNRVVAHLPERKLRSGKAPSSPPSAPTENAPGPSFRNQGSRKETLQEFAEGKRSVIHAVRHQIDAFKSPFPPNFSELTYRVLSEDRQWRTVLGIPVEMIVRLMDILPGIFVVFGIFGTFIGIASALPMISSIDLGRIQDSGPILKQFIDAVSLSMRCSIAGIFCSIFTTVLNAMYPLYTSRAEVRRSLDRCFELMWHRLHGYKVSVADQRIIALLETIAEGFKARAASPAEAPPATPVSAEQKAA